jgi:hypothetical protein
MRIRANFEGSLSRNPINNFFTICSTCVYVNISSSSLCLAPFARESRASGGPHPGMSCFGKLCATEAGKKPKKWYNTIVPAVFLKDALKWNEPLDAATTRNIGTVQEYVEENVQRAPKVSRRLWRRFCHDIPRSNQVGNVKVRTRSE